MYPSMASLSSVLVCAAGIASTSNAKTGIDDFRTVHMLWIMMGMEIVSTDREPVDRHTRRRAENLRHQEVRVIRLRRPQHHAEPSGEHRTSTGALAGWSGATTGGTTSHGGTFKDGRTRTYVKPYIKGDDDKPLKVSDILYRLSRLTPAPQNPPGSAVTMVVPPSVRPPRRPSCGHT